MAPVANGRPFIFARAIANAGSGVRSMPWATREDHAWGNAPGRGARMARGYSDAGKLGVVTADDITQALVKIDASVAELQATINACPKLDATTLAQWNAWKAGYVTFSAANQNLGYWTLGLPAIGDEAVSYEDDLQQWFRAIGQAIQASGCGVPMPPTPETHEQAADEGGNPVADIVKDVAWLVGIGAVVYFGVVYLPRPRPRHLRR